MFRAELSARECGGRVVVTLRRKLDVLEAVRFAAALVTVAARTWRFLPDSGDQAGRHHHATGGWRR
jgi:hypothetical protein